jgi:hypothetical protein
MSEKSNALFPYISILIAAIPIFIGVYEYNSNNQREFGKSFLSQQSVVYEELLGYLGGISTAISNPDDSLSRSNYVKAKFNFNQLYYGKLNLYQNPNIERLTDSLFNMVNSYDNASAYGNQKELLGQMIDSFQVKVYQLSVECKKSLKNTYDLK